MLNPIPPQPLAKRSLYFSMSSGGACRGTRGIGVGTVPMSVTSQPVASKSSQRASRNHSAFASKFRVRGGAVRYLRIVIRFRPRRNRTRETQHKTNCSKVYRPTPRVHASERTAMCPSDNERRCFSSIKERSVYCPYFHMTGLGQRLRFTGSRVSG